MGAFGSGVLVDEGGDGVVGDTWETKVDCCHELRAGQQCCQNRMGKGG